MEREEVANLLLEEVYLLRDSYNITALPILDVLERLVPPEDPRWVALARERSHILEVHHHHEAAARWIECAELRLRHPAVRWGGQEHKYIEASNIVYRKLSQRLSVHFVRGTLPAKDDAVMNNVLSGLARLVDERSTRFREWLHMADRYHLQRKSTTRVVERRLGLCGDWSDDELSGLDAIDDEVADLAMSHRTLGWVNRRLAILLEADRPREFMRTLEETSSLFREHGAMSGNQLSTLHTVTKAAMTRRWRNWRKLRLDIDDIMAQMPENDDGFFRDPLAIPRPLIVKGVPFL